MPVSPVTNELVPKSARPLFTGYVSSTFNQPDYTSAYSNAINTL